MLPLLLFVALAASRIEAGYNIIGGGHDGGHLYANYHGEYAASYDNYVPKPYSFEYGVSDHHTGDHKHQWETKDEHGVVRGSYSLLEPDGTTRIVDYIADKGGFRAIVKRITHHGTVSIENHGNSELATPIIVAEPEPLVVHRIAQPVIHHEEPLSFGSYDGGYEDYQHLVPHEVKLESVQEEPKHQIILSHPEINVDHGVLHQTVQPHEQEYHGPVYTGPQHHDIETYQVTYSHPEIQHYHEEAAPVPIRQYHQEEHKPSVHYSAPLVHNHHQPVESYSYEQTFEAPTDWAEAAVRESVKHPGHVISHPHGDSSQSFFSITGNVEDH